MTASTAKPIPGVVKARGDTVYCLVAKQNLTPTTARTDYHYSGGRFDEAAFVLPGRQGSKRICTQECGFKCSG